MKTSQLAENALSLQSPKISSNPSNDAVVEEVLKKAEEEKNFKGLKDELLKIHKKNKKEETKKKVTG